MNAKKKRRRRTSFSPNAPPRDDADAVEARKTTKKKVKRT
jgi:hypothetical protein